MYILFYDLSVICSIVCVDDKSLHADVTYIEMLEY
jgi:hypothetical protein